MTVKLWRWLPCAHDRTEWWFLIFPHFGTLTLQPKKQEVLICNVLGFKKQNEKKKKPPKVLPRRKLSSVLSQFLSQLTVMVICGRPMLTSVCLRGVTDDHVALAQSSLISWENLLCIQWGNPPGRRRHMSWEKPYECGHGCQFYIFQHKAELLYCFYSTPQFPSCFLACFLTESA